MFIISSNVPIPADTVAAVKFNHDSSLVATAGLDGVVKSWSTATGGVSR